MPEQALAPWLSFFWRICGRWEHGIRGTSRSTPILNQRKKVRAYRGAGTHSQSPASQRLSQAEFPLPHMMSPPNPGMGDSDNQRQGGRSWVEAKPNFLNVPSFSLGGPRSRWPSWTHGTPGKLRAGRSQELRASSQLSSASQSSRHDCERLH